jgi:large subunit ribosomal protein L17
MEGEIKTTEAKAKLVKRLIDKVITRAKKPSLNSRRLVQKTLVFEPAVNKLVAELAPRFSSRTSGYTRLTKLGNRSGDDTMMVRVSFVDRVAPTTVAAPVLKKSAPVKAAEVVAKPEAVKPATKKTTKPAVKKTTKKSK